MKRLMRSAIGGIIAASMVIGSAAAAGLLFFTTIASTPPPETLTPRDAIIVLTGGSNRLESGFDLLEKKAGKKLFISGVYRGTEMRTLLERWRSEPKASLDCCVVLGQAENTVENARESIDWLRREGFTSIYLVTANYHIPRALLEFKDRAPDLDIVPFPVAPDNLDMKAWWENASLRGLVLKEYIKYVTVYILQKLPHA